MNAFLDSFKHSLLFKILLVNVFFFSIWNSNAQIDRKTKLYKTLKSKDSIIFERGFNNCELEKLKLVISDSIEFYHDISGIQYRKEFMDAIKNNVCSNPGNFTRLLVEKSLEVFPMKNNGILYGAIQNGKHAFQIKENKILKTVGIANFTHLWILENKIWKLKRVLSFNHKPYSE